MSTLLNAVTTSETLVEYDRSFAGSYDNPLDGLPSLQFHMQRVVVRERDGKVLSNEVLPTVVEPFEAGKVYELYNPQTGERIPGQAFVAEQAYAILYSIMRRATSQTA